MNVGLRVKFLRNDADVELPERLDRPALLKMTLVRVKPGLMQWGAYVRKTAERLTNKRRRMRPSQMPEQMRKWYEAKKRDARRHGRARPKAPWASSEPGKPPFRIVGLIPRLMAFDVEDMDAKAARRTVVVGPGLANGAKNAGVTPRTLEEGGHATYATRTYGTFFANRKKEGAVAATLKTQTHLIAKRPYMTVAMHKSFPGGSAGRFFRDIF